MVNHTLKILRCEHRKMIKVCLAIFQHLYMKGLSYVFNFKGFFKFREGGAVWWDV